MSDQASPSQMRWIGLGLGLAGLYGMLIGLEVAPVPGGRDNLHGPLWLALLIGFAVFLAGAAALIQSIGRANAGLPADAPFWMRLAQYLIVVALFASFATLGSFVAIGGDPRYFSGGTATIARIAFGAGALICWLATAAYAVIGARKLLRRGDG